MSMGICVRVSAIVSMDVIVFARCTTSSSVLVVLMGFQSRRVERMRVALNRDDGLVSVSWVWSAE